MRKIQISFASLFLLLTLLWLHAEGFLFTTYIDFVTWRGLLYWSGITAIGAMSVSMILAMRLKFIEPWLGGLDKMYRLHKCLGIAGLALSITHWSAKQAPSWFAVAGAVRPARPPVEMQTNAILAYFQSLHGVAEGVGNPAFYALIGLVVLALLKWFPYKYFFKTHRLLSVVYLVLVFHSVVLMKFTYWGAILGPVMGFMMFLGSIGAVLSLVRGIGRINRAAGKVSGFEYHPGVKVLRIDAKLSSDWPGHQAGQFAFVTLDQSEGAHPFTITSNWADDGKLSFLVKELGDYTSKLADMIKLGAEVIVEGPYGDFRFESGKRHQIWIGGGIGIAPFVARMKTLAATPDGRKIDLFHATAVYDESAIAKLREDVAASGVALHLSVDARDGFLTAEKLIAQVPDWKEADIWFCGPVAMGKALQSGLCSKGLLADDFDAELFAIR